MIRARTVPVVMEEVTDPAELAQARARGERFRRNWTWFEARAPEVYTAHRGKCICVAGEELFVADSPQEVLALAAATHPQDDGRFTLYIPRERMARVYASQRGMDPLSCFAAQPARLEPAATRAATKKCGRRPPWW